MKIVSEHARRLSVAQEIHRLMQPSRLLQFVVLTCWLIGVPCLGQEEIDSEALSASIGTAGAYRYQSGSWGVLSVRGENATESDAEALVSVFLGKDTLNQFARRFWVPSGARRLAWLPIRVPQTIPADQNSLEVSALHLIESAAGPAFERRSGEPIITDSLFALDAAKEVRVGLILRRNRPDDPDLTKVLDDDAFELLDLTRTISRCEAPAMVLHDQFLPPYPEAYDGLDQLFVCGEQLLADSGALSAIRTWLVRGGRMWVMLDRTSLDVLDAVLGNASTCQIVDRVELNDFVIETPGLAMRNEESRERWVSEEPVDFVRVLADSVEVHSHIDGWPAAFSWKVGRGQLLATTLSPRGWRHESSEFDDLPDGIPDSGPTRALAELAGQYHAARPRGLLEESKAEISPILQEQIGYEIPSRSLAGSILGANFGVLLGLAVWLTRRHKLEHLAWVIPAATVSTAILLILVGSSQTSQVPPTAAVVQLVNVASETNEARSTSLISLFSSTTSELLLESPSSSSSQPDVTNLAGVTKRTVWDDSQSVQWENIDVASGSVRSVVSQANVTLTEPIRARGTFGPEGFSGTLHGAHLLGSSSEAVIAWPPSPNTAVEFTSDSRFVCGEADVMAGAQYIRGGLLTDQQRRHQEIYRLVLDPADNLVYPERSTLFVWGKPQQIGVSIPEEFETIGSALYAIPLEIERMPKGSDFVIPSSFIRMENAAGRWGVSGVYDARKGKWREDATAPTDALFRFVLPSQILPCRVTKATLRLKVHAPSRRVDLTALSAGEKVSLQQRESPSGIIELVVEQPELLEIDRDGGILFGVSVSQTAQQIEALQGGEGKTKRNAPGGDLAAEDRKQIEDADQKIVEATSFEPWQIDYLRIQVAGEAL
jgi:hypothetical protein